MNQILSVENKKNTKPKKRNIKSIIIVFSIMMMIFGIGMTSSGAYAFYKNKTNDEGKSVKTISNTKPSITIERISVTQIKIVITHSVELSSVSYKLNGDDEISIDTNGQSKVDETIDLPSGTSNIVVDAKDINGVSAEYENSFNVDQVPTINLDTIETQIQISVSSEINIDYVSYYWDDDEANATVFKINDLSTKTLVDVLSGSHTLHVKAVDINGSEAEKSQKVIGDNKPEVIVKRVGDQLIVSAKDDEQLSKIEITYVNTNETKTEEINSKEYNTTIDLESGENKFIIEVFNKNGVSETKKIKSTKE